MATREDQLKAIPLFSGLTHADLQFLAGQMDEVSIPADTVLITEGVGNHAFFVILEGVVDVSVGGKYRRTLGPQDFFGEISIQYDGARCSDGNCSEPNAGSGIRRKSCSVQRGEGSRNRNAPAQSRDGSTAARRPKTQGVAGLRSGGSEPPTFTGSASRTALAANMSESVPRKASQRSRCMARGARARRPGRGAEEAGGRRLG